MAGVDAERSCTKHTGGAENGMGDADPIDITAVMLIL
jgi:hypothetical protein